LGLTEIVKPEPLIPNGGIWYQMTDIQLQFGIENEINTFKRHPTFEVSDLEEAKQHLTRHGVTLKEETYSRAKTVFIF
jgi:hypothetical protein